LGHPGGADAVRGVTGVDPQDVPQQHPGRGIPQFTGGPGILDLTDPLNLCRIQRPAQVFQDPPGVQQLVPAESVEFGVPQFLDT